MRIGKPVAIAGAVIFIGWAGAHLLVNYIGTSMLRIENRNFEAIRKKSELDCQTMPFHCAVRDNKIHELEKMKANGLDVNARNRWGQTAVLYAIRQKSPAVLPLIRIGADLNLSDENSQVPLQLALRIKEYQLAKTLVEHGADLNSKTGWDQKKMTLLTEAITHKDVEAASFLVKEGASLQLKDDYGYTPCERANMYHTTALFPFCKG